MTAPDRPGDGAQAYYATVRGLTDDADVHRAIDAAEADRPGDRDQQQAAEALWGMSSDPGVMLPADGRKLARVAAARAEEAARWRAKIEALADSLETGYKRTKFDDGALLASALLRAVLDAS